MQAWPRVELESRETGKASGSTLSAPTQFTAAPQVGLQPWAQGWVMWAPLADSILLLHFWADALSQRIWEHLEEAEERQHPEKNCQRWVCLRKRHQTHCWGLKSCRHIPEKSTCPLEFSGMSCSINHMAKWHKRKLSFWKPESSPSTIPLFPFRHTYSVSGTIMYSLPLNPHIEQGAHFYRCGS